MWELFETVYPTLEWVLLDEVFSEASTLKVEHLWDTAGDVFPGKAWIHIGQRFSDGSLLRLERVYPYREPRLVHFAIPEDMAAAGFDSYQIQVRADWWRYWDGLANWRVLFYRLQARGGGRRGGLI